MPENQDAWINALQGDIFMKYMKSYKTNQTGGEKEMTQYYVGVKIVEAFPQEKDGKPGYGVKYPDGYLSWSPKDVFESAYLPMGVTNNNKVTPEMVQQFLSPKCEARQLDEKTVLVKGEMLSGFTQYETGACVDPANFNMEVGTEVAIKRIKDTVWKCLGFVVQWGKFGLTGNIK